MGSKRSAENDGNITSKRRRGQTPSKPGKSSSNADQAYGQRGAFGSLEDATTAPAWDSDLDCEDDSAALAYLRSVRVQASGIPHVLVAKKAGPLPPPRLSADGVTKQEDEDEGEDDGVVVDRAIYENGIGDSRGYYHDGAYTALPEDYHQDYDDEEEEDYEGEANEEEYGQEYDEEEEEGEAKDCSGSSGGRPRNSSADEIRDAYFAALTRRFLTLRGLLRTEPPPGAVAALAASSPTQVGRAGGCGGGGGGSSPSSKTMARWSGLLKATDPRPAQVAAMRKDSVVRLLRVVLGGKALFREGHALRERTSRWVWALLARLPDRGELDHREVGWVRELGKRAVLCMLNLAEREALRERYDVGDGDGDGDGDSDGGGGGEQGVPDVEVHDEEGVDEEELTRPSCDADIGGPAVENKEDEARASGPANAQNDDDPGKADGTSVGANPRPPEEQQQQHHSDPTATQQATLPADGASMDAKRSPSPLPSAPSPSPPSPHAGPEQGQEASDVEMQLDTEVEEGEVSGDEPPRGQKGKQTEKATEDSQAAVERAKARLLAQIGGGDAGGERSSPEADPGPALARVREQEEEEEAAARAQINMRATLNMILTVAGEFYGQRDLLEFRNPFSRLSEE